ncbi:MAG TPA: MtrB/PioB family decaheme-associated outer membrane protein [Burkholderiales bacterium]|jgi:MtrB/PioB family decaheme-associated outer membrane protein|nr:MtrB/PioB family decaheme-associated outer membrane protein [Burkholderiales bacterium]
MTKAKKLPSFCHSAIALAILAAYGSAGAQEIDALMAPGNSLSVGVGFLSGDEKDRARFGLFNGLRTEDYRGLLGFSIVDRNADTGRWFSVEGRNLGLDNREVAFSYRRLGDMKLWGEYSEITRHDPRTINTGLIGAGTTTPTVQVLAAPGSGYELNLKLQRKGISLNAEKWFGGSLQMEINFKNEDKEGARFFGKGFACASATAPGCLGPTAAATGWAFLMLPEPVNSTIRQIDAKLNYVGTNLNLSGGYYGSFYTNANGNITPSVPGSLINGVGTLLPLSAGLQPILNLPVALWPDNQAQQLFLSGNYKFTPSTKMNFKYSFTHMTQKEDFLSMGLANAPAGRSNLGGTIDWTKAQVGIVSHPWGPLHVHADLKFDEKKDKTPVAVYNLEGVNTYTNTVPSPKKLDGKIGATYALPAGFSAGADVYFEKEDFGTFTPSASVAGLSGIRQKLKETGYRLELRKSLSETVNGMLSYNHAKREGDGPWLKPNSLPLTGVFEASPDCLSVGANACIFSRTAIFPFMFLDRDRDKVKLLANWSPSRELDFTFFVEDGKDKYSGPTESGLRDTRMTMFNADVSYSLSDAWKLSAYLSQGRQRTSAGHSTGYDGVLTDTNSSFGTRLTGKVSSRLNVGADLVYLNDVLKYHQDCDPACSATNAAFLAIAGGLPDVTYRLTRLTLFGAYAIDKTSYVRLDVVHERTKFNEWTYNFNGVPWTYSDRTTLGAKENQQVTFVGASYIFRFE